MNKVTLTLQEIEKACVLSEMAGDDVGVTLKSNEVRYLIDINKRLLDVCKSVLVGYRNLVDFNIIPTRYHSTAKYEIESLENAINSVEKIGMLVYTSEKGED